MDCVTLVLLVRGVESTIVLPMREAHGDGGEVQADEHNILYEINIVSMKQ